MFVAPSSASRYNQQRQQQQQQRYAPQAEYNYNNYNTYNNSQQYQLQHHQHQQQQQSSTAVIHRSPDRSALHATALAVTDSANRNSSAARRKSATAASNSTSATSTSNRNHVNNNIVGSPPRYPTTTAAAAGGGGASGTAASAYASTGGGGYYGTYQGNSGMMTPREGGGDDDHDVGGGGHKGLESSAARHPGEHVLETPPEGMDSLDEAGNPITYIEVPVIEEVVRHVPVYQEVVMERYQPKIEVEWVDKIVQVPEIRYTDRPVDVPVVEEVVRHVTRKEVIEVPREVVKHVSKVETVVVEKLVEVPGEVVEVPKPYVVENKIPVPVVIDQQVPVLVAQIIQPVITGVSEHSREVLVTNYKPNVHIVDVPVARPIKSCLVNNGILKDECQVVQVPPGQYNTLLRHLNRHLDVPERSSFIPYIPDTNGAIVFADEFCPPGGPIAVPMPLINSPAPASAGASISAPVVPGYDDPTSNLMMSVAPRSASRSSARGGRGSRAGGLAGSMSAFPAQSNSNNNNNTIPAPLTSREVPTGRRRRNSHRSAEPALVARRRPMTARAESGRGGDQESSSGGRQRSRRSIHNNSTAAGGSQLPQSSDRRAGPAQPQPRAGDDGWSSAVQPPQWAQRGAAAPQPAAYRARVVPRGATDGRDAAERPHARRHHPHHKPENLQQRREIRGKADTAFTADGEERRSSNRRH